METKFDDSICAWFDFLDELEVRNQRRANEIRIKYKIFHVLLEMAFPAIGNRTSSQDNQVPLLIFHTKQGRVINTLDELVTNILSDNVRPL